MHRRHEVNLCCKASLLWLQALESVAIITEQCNENPLNRCRIGLDIVEGQATLGKVRWSPSGVNNRMLCGDVEGDPLGPGLLMELESRSYSKHPNWCSVLLTQGDCRLYLE